MTDIDEFDQDMLEKSNYYEYEMPRHDRNSLAEIRRKIRENGYSDPLQVEAHQDFLEHLANRLQRVMENERHIGKINWELERQLNEIKEIYSELEIVRKKLTR